MSQSHFFKNLTTPKNWLKTRYSLRRTMFFAFLFVTLLPLLLISAIALIVSGANNQQNISGKLVAVSVSKEQALNRWLENTNYLLSNERTLELAGLTLYEFERRPERAERLISDFRYDMLNIRGIAGNFTAVSVLDKNGVVKASTNLGEVNRNYQNEEVFQQGITGLYRSPLFYDPKTGEPTLLIAMPLSGPSQELVGVLSARVDLTEIKNILGETTGLGRESETYLATQDEVILTPNLAPHTNPQMTVAVSRGVSGINDTGLYANYEGVPVVGAYRWLNDLGVVLLAEQTQKVAFAGTRQVLLWLLLFSLFVIAADMYLGYIITYRIVSPIQELTSTAATISADIDYGNINQTNAFQREDEIGTLARAFDIMTTRLRDFINTLESRVQDRTQELAERSAQLQTAIDVSKVANTILDTDALIQDTVYLIKEQFNFYYVGLFLVDRPGEWAVLRAGTGEAGQKQLQNKHRLKIDDHSMIGWSMAHREARIAGDVGLDEVRYKNPYLPETHSEMALPLISRDEALGALSIQSTERNAFSEADIIVLQAVADQLATALQNSRLFSRAQAIQARFEDLYHRAPAGYHTLALDGTILEINDTELSMLGYEGERERIINRRRITDFMTPDCTGTFEQAFSKLFEGAKIENLELTYARKDGSHLPVSMNVALEMDAEGKPVEIYASVQDISRQRTLLARTEMLYQLGQQLLSVENQPEIYQTCIDAIKIINPSRGIAIFLYERAPNAIEFKLSALWDNPQQEWPPVSLGMTLSDTELGLQDILLTGNTVTSADGTTDSQFTPTLQQLLEFMQIKGLAGTPVWSSAKVIGFILVGNHTPDPFSEEKIRFLESVARQMSVSIDNLTHLQEALDRAIQLEAAAEVAKATTADINLSTLLPNVINLIDRSFGYYHTAIFLVDAYNQFAVMRAASGAVGQQLAAEGYKITINKNSQIGSVIINGKLKLTGDVRRSSTFMAHSLLPHTRSELSLPLIVQGQTIGVLDAQSAALGDFQSGEITVLQTIADQIANAIHISRLFKKEREAAQEVQELHNRYLQQEWEAYLDVADRAETTKYALLPDSAFDSEALIEQATQEWLAQSDPSPAAFELHNDEDPAWSRSALMSTLPLRGASIGAVGLIDQSDREWTKDDLAIIEAVSAQAALAIENARLIDETQQWALQLQTSTEISRVVTASLDIDTLISDSVNLVQSQFKLNAVQLYLINAAGNRQTGKLYQNIQAQGITPALEDVSIGETSLTSKAINQQETLLAQESYLALQQHIPPSAADAKSALIIPLIVHQEAIGALEIYGRQPNAFTEEQVTVLEILASQIAIAIENARAYREQQEIANQLREVDKLKTQFLANMSHELRTPLNSIIGFSRVILKGIDGPLTELQRADLTSIYQSGKHLLDLINNILDLAKIDAGKMDLNFEMVDLNNLVDSISATAKGLVKDKNIKIVKDVSQDLPAIEGDETRIRQILLNLVSNAAKFATEGSITISASSNQDTVTVSVTDTGRGIPVEGRDSIFEEFTQVDASTTRKAGGTGLGLPITRKFIELHHGNISVESDLNVGSTFTITLPIIQPETSGPRRVDVLPDAQAVQEEKVKTTPSLLVVDNDPRVVDYYRQYLNGKDIDFVTPNTGSETVKTAKDLQPYAILLDVLLLDIDGWTLLGDLKSNPHTAHIPVIICSIIEDRFRATKLGASDYLVKPIIKSDLVQAIEKLEEHKEYNRRVLVIDDRAEDILLIKRILEAHNCQILQASNGLDGLEIIFSNPPDLVILDLTMPDLDGFGVLDSVRNNPATSAIPIVVISARELTPTEQETVTRQADALLCKGKFTDVDLIQYVDQFLHPVLPTITA